MKSFAIKTNNKVIIEYLLEKINNCEIKDIHLSERKFKIYTNIIIHYKEENEHIVKKLLKDIITDTILEFYKERIIKRIINYNYFYFDEHEKNRIKLNSYNIIDSPEYGDMRLEKNYINKSVRIYLKENSSIVLDGFVNFRLNEYTNYLDNVVDIAVNKYIIEKEYIEFISLLKIYVNSKSPRGRFCVFNIF